MIPIRVPERQRDRNKQQKEDGRRTQGHNKSEFKPRRTFTLGRLCLWPEARGGEREE